jgi:hypothetical protein
MIFLETIYTTQVVEVEVLIIIVLVTLAQVVMVEEEMQDIKVLDNQEPQIQVVAVVE